LEDEAGAPRALGASRRLTARQLDRLGRICRESAGLSAQNRRLGEALNEIQGSLAHQMRELENARQWRGAETVPTRNGPRETTGYLEACRAVADREQTVERIEKERERIHAEREPLVRKIVALRDVAQAVRDYSGRNFADLGVVDPG
jgi:hypothetical protein